jgi:methionyl-tRNA synthetase
VALPQQVFGHGWVYFKGERMSKTMGNIVDPLDAADRFGPDPLRLYLAKEVPYGGDGDFTWERFEEKYNADLANNLGNLLARVATVVGSKCGGTGPAPTPDSPLAGVAAEAYAGAAAGWADFQPADALAATWRLIRATNAHLEANEPWKAEPGPAVEAVLGDALEALRIVAVLASPAIPEAAQVIWERIGLPGSVTGQRLPDAAAWGAYPGGLRVEKGASLFPRKQ